MLPHLAAAPKPAGYCRASVSLAQHHQASTVAAAKQVPQRLPESIQAKVQTAVDYVSNAKHTSTAASAGLHTSKLCHKARTAGLRLSAASRCKSAAHTRLLPLYEAAEPAYSSLSIRTVQQKVSALKASANAVLNGLNWADSQLTCSTSPPAASAPARNSSTASSTPQHLHLEEATAAGTDAARDSPVAGRKTHSAECCKATHEQRLCSLAIPRTSLHRTTADTKGQDDIAGQDDMAGQGLVLGSGEQLAGGTAFLATRPCSAERRRGGSPADSDATWSECESADAKPAGSTCKQFRLHTGCLS